MAEDKQKITENQETIDSSDRKQEELSEKDLDKASGGALGSEKWIEVDSFQWGVGKV